MKFPKLFAAELTPEEEYKMRLERSTCRVALGAMLLAGFIFIAVGGAWVLRWSYDQDPDRYGDQVRDPYLP